MLRSLRAVAPLLALLAALLAHPGRAALAPRYTDWFAGPVQHLLTDEERAAFPTLADDAAAEQFVRLFWARRDPTPESDENEARREFERRVVTADRLFGEVDENEQPIRGALTDRGRIFILLGPPHRRENPGSSGVSQGGDFGVGETPVGPTGSISSGGGPGRFGRGGTQERFGAASEERWTYEGDEKPDWITKRRVTIRFRTTPKSGRVELHDPAEALALAAEGARRMVVRPALTAADLVATAGSALDAPLASFGLHGASPDAVAALATAFAADAPTPAPAPGETAHLDAGVFQATDGTFIIPFQLALPAPPAGHTVVGELLAADGGRAVAFALDAWQPAKDQHVVHATLVPPAGNHTLRLVLRRADGTVAWRGEQALAVPAATASPALWLSPLLLAEEIGPLPRAQQMLEPFAWQGIAIVPKGDRRFSHGDALWFYLHVCHPTLDASGAPQVQAIVEVRGPARFRGPMRSQPAKAGDACFILAEALDVVPEVLPAGDYTIEVQATDKGAGTSASTRSAFTVAAP